MPALVAGNCVNGQPLLLWAVASLALLWPQVLTAFFLGSIGSLLLHAARCCILSISRP